MQKYKFNLSFRLEQRKDKKTGEIISKQVPILADISFSGKRIFFPIGYRIDESKWIDRIGDEKIQRVKKNNFNSEGESAADINARITRINKATEEVFRKLEFGNLTPTPNIVRFELKSLLDEVKTENKTFFEYYRMFIEEQSMLNTWSISTVKKHTTVLNQFKEFRKNLYFEDLTEETLAKYVKFLLARQKTIKGKTKDEKDRIVFTNNNNYIQKCLKIFKWFMDWATKRGYNRNTDYKKFNPKLKGISSRQNIIALTVEEFLHLYSMEIEEKYLDRVRDVFCFCCATSLRYSDVRNLKWKNIKDDHMEITTVKTDDMLRIPLNDYSRKILEKYREISSPEDLCLPVVSNQKYNDYLKILGELAGFDSIETVISYHGSQREEKSHKKWELLTSHVARKTFVTFGILLEIPFEVIRTFTGHKDPKMMERYYQIGIKEQSRFMDKFKVIKNTQDNESKELANL